MKSHQDKVMLQLPGAEQFRPLLHMVLGGIGIRRDLSFDALDDLQLAVDSVLAGDKGSIRAPLTMTVTVDDTLTVNLEPLKDKTLKAMLSEGQVPKGAEDKCIDVCVLLRSLVDGYVVKDIDGESFAVEMQKAVGDGR